MAYKYIDPVAQSFIVDTPCIVTKIGLYFTEKDPAIPAFVHIRDMDNGYPGNYQVPFSEKVIRPSSITLSSGSTLNENQITFSSPIYLERGEYALCVGSPSSLWKTCVSRIGSTDIPSAKKINLQPYVGSLFKSQNASTWTAEQELDLTFKIYRATFDTSAAASVEFKINNDNANNTDILPDNPLKVVSGSTLMRVTHPNHGMSNGDFVKLGGTGKYQYLPNGSAVLNFGIDFNEFLDADHTEIIPLQISNVTTNTYTITLPNSQTATETAVFGGNRITATKNTRVDAIQPIISKIVQSGTGSVNRVKLTTPNNTLESNYSVITDDITELNAPRIIPSAEVKSSNYFSFTSSLTTTNKYLSPIIDTKKIGIVAASNILNNPSYSSENNLAAFDETTIISATSTTITQIDGDYGQIAIPTASQDAVAAMTIGTQLTITGGSNAGDYRIVDIEEDGSIVYIINIDGDAITTQTTSITVVNGDKYISEEAASGGTVSSRYITRQLDFLNPCTAFNVRLFTNRPRGSNIEFYYKTKLAGEAVDLDTKEFVKLTGLTVPVSLDDKFEEVEYQTDLSSPLDSFESIIFKIVFTSTNTTRVPKCKDLRLIALA